MKTILDFARAKQSGRKIVLLTAYDALAARLLAASEADAILVGDSLAMVAHGFDSTVHATLDMMCAHTAAVRRGAPDAFVVADMPFLSMRLGEPRAVEAAGRLLQAGASAVKIEGVEGQEGAIRQIIGSGIPVMGHLGLTPQSVHQLGGHRVQGRSEKQAAQVRRDAATLVELGAFAIVVECIPATLAGEIAAGLAVPVIGIGAGPSTDGQVLVLSDLLGLDPEFRPSFVRRYRAGFEEALEAVNNFSRDVRTERFPAPAEVPA